MSQTSSFVRLAILPCLMALALTNVAAAQVTAEQQSAIRASCRNDFTAKCSGVQPGGKDALLCLQKNVASLAPACKAAVGATIPAAPKPTRASAAPASTAVAAATTPTTEAQRAAIQQSCRSDFMANCSGVQPGGQAALACLQKSTPKLTPACKQAVAALGTTPANTATAEAATAAAPTKAQLSAVKNTCRADFKSYCRGVQPGGAEALACLQRNATRLTPGCRTSLADIADAIPATPAAAAVATTTPAAAPAPHRRLPAITPAGRILRRVMERNQ